MEKKPNKAALKVTGYCVKCKKKKTISNPVRVTMANGRAALKGSCPVCGTGMFRILGMAE